MKTKKYKFAILLSSLIVLSLACGQIELGVVPATPTETVEIEVTTDIPTDTPQPAITSEPQDQKSSKVWMSTTRRTGTKLPDMLAGLVYEDREALWLVDQNGRSVLVIEEGYTGLLSPEGDQVLYSSDMEQGEDIYLFDLNTEETRQLTDTADVFESSFQWWPERPEVVVFNYTPEEQLGPWSGYLGAVNIDSGERIVLDDQSVGYGSFALSPDGRRIAYDNASEPMLLIWGQEPKALNTEAWGLDFEGYIQPAWSPDGKQIAFHASRPAREDEGWGVIRALVIVNLESQEARVLHQHTSIGQRGGPKIAWSPDGEWIAVINFGETDPSLGATTLWVIRADGSGEEVNLGYATEPVWSPDGSRLIYTQWPAPSEQEGSYMQDAHITVVETGIWQPQEIEPLLGYVIKGWIEIDGGGDAPEQPETSSDLGCQALDVGSAEGLACQIQEALLKRDMNALQTLMQDPFIIGYWGSEGRTDSPEGITAELDQSRLPQDTSGLSFTSDPSQFPPLQGMPPEKMFGPDVNVALIVYSEGWGPDGKGAALIYIAKDVTGEPYWHGLVFSGGRYFDK